MKNIVSGTCWPSCACTMKCQQQGVPWQQAVARNHCQCNQRCVEDKAEFSALAKSTSVQVWNSTSKERLQAAQDET